MKEYKQWQLNQETVISNCTGNQSGHTCFLVEKKKSCTVELQAVVQIAEDQMAYSHIDIL